MPSGGASFGGDLKHLGYIEADGLRASTGDIVAARGEILGLRGVVTSLPFVSLWEVNPSIVRTDLTVAPNNLTGDNTPATVQLDVAGGGISVTSNGGSDNDEVAFHSNGQMFLNAATKDIVMRARIRFTEAATNAGNWFFGICDVLANVIIDDGAGIVASGDAIGIYKVDGSMFFRTAAVINGTDGGSAGATATAFASDTWYDLRIEVDASSTISSTVASSSANVTFWVDDTVIDTATISYTSATECYGMVYAKAGSAAVQDIDIAYAQISQVR